MTTMLNKPFYPPAGLFIGAETVVFAEKGDGVELLQFNNYTKPVYAEGDYVYQRVGVVKKIEKEIELDRVADIVVGYKWSYPNHYTYEVKALHGEDAWVLVTAGSARMSYMSTMKVGRIPRRKATGKVTNLEVVKG